MSEYHPGIQTKMMTLFKFVSKVLVIVTAFTLNPRGSMAFRQDQINFHFIPGISNAIYSNIGDINIGALVYVYTSGRPFAERCSTSTRSNMVPAESTEAIAFAVDVINRDPDLLPNVTLGFVTRGVCSSRNVALATSLLFLPRAERVCNGSTCYSMPMTSPPNESTWLSHDVIGVMGMGYSSVAMAISTLYGAANLVMMGVEESSDDFSSKRNHPTFFRVNSPDRYQVRGILTFISDRGWSYISVLYSEGDYGENAYKNIYENVESFGICIATSHMILHNTDFDAVVADLLTYNQARVVILFLTGTRFWLIMRAAHRLNVTGHFIWIGSDSSNSYKGYNNYGGDDYVPDDKDPAVGAFSFDLYFTYINDFYHHLGSQSPITTKNPWLQRSFEATLQCSYDANTCDPDADIFQAPKYRAGKYAPLRIDAVFALAHAAHNLLKEHCPDARGRDARACITRRLFHEYLANVDFEGYNGRVRFDENQDLKGKYLIGQYVYDYLDYPFTNRTKWKHITRKPVGVYDAFTNSITYFKEPITWSHLKTSSHLASWMNGSLGAPDSTCSYPCEVGEYKIEKEVPCCWECRRCRDNERLVEGNTSCEQCPRLSWPDPFSGFTRCQRIPPVYPKINETLPLALIAVASLALTMSILTSILYWNLGDKKVIKASSKELSILQLVAIFLGYLTVILFQVMPSDILCTAIFFLFCMSFSLLYCPLVVKTVRIFRIFQGGANKTPPRFISPKSQVLFSATLIAIQLAMCMGIYVFFWPKSKLTQPIWTEKLVELSCDLTLPGMASFLGYNIVLVSLCSVLAFLTRKLPDNFNESKFISMCVSTTLLIWLAFVPTYFTADREFIRAFLLSVALLLNHSVALLLLFAPKVYAAKFLPEESGKFSSMMS